MERGRGEVCILERLFPKADLYWNHDRQLGNHNDKRHWIRGCLSQQHNSSWANGWIQTSSPTSHRHPLFWGSDFLQLRNLALTGKALLSRERKSKWFGNISSICWIVTTPNSTHRVNSKDLCTHHKDSCTHHPFLFVMGHSSVTSGVWRWAMSAMGFCQRNGSDHRQELTAFHHGCLGLKRKCKLYAPRITM